MVNIANILEEEQRRAWLAGSCEFTLSWKLVEGVGVD